MVVLFLLEARCSFKRENKMSKGQLQSWLDEDWVRIGADGSIKENVGIEKNQKENLNVYQGTKQIALVKKKEQG